MRKRHLWMLIAGVTLLQAGCGTIINGSYQKIHVRTTPPGAEVIVQCKTLTPGPVITPAKVQVHRKTLPCSLLVRKEGYREVSVELKRRTTGVRWGNIAFGPLGSFGTLSSWHWGDNSNDEKRDAMAGAVLAIGITFMIDYATGGAYERIPEEVDLVLERQSE